MQIITSPIGLATAQPAAEQTAPLVPVYATIETWMVLSGMSRRVVYEELGKGNLKAKKHGSSIRIDVQHGLAFMRSLPDATIRAPKPRQAD